MFQFILFMISLNTHIAHVNADAGVYFDFTKVDKRRPRNRTHV